MAHILDSLTAGLNNWGAAFCDHAMAVLVQTTLVAAAVFLLDRLLVRRVRAGVRYWVWMLVLVKLVLPPNLTSPFSITGRLGHYGSEVWADWGPADERPERGGRVAPALPVLPSQVGVQPYQTTFAEVIRAAEQAEQNNKPLASVSIEIPLGPRTLSGRGVLFAIWILVAGALLTALCVRLWLIRKMVGRAVPADGKLRSLLAEACRTVGILPNRVRVRVSTEVPGPAICGILSPTILLPQSLVEQLHTDYARTIFIHELIHLKRRDMHVAMVQAILQVAFFYNPVIWLVNRTIRRLRELAVDEAVLATRSQAPSDYTEVLIVVATLLPKRAASMLGFVGVLESPSCLKQRIDRILTRPVPRSTRLGLGGAALVLLCAGSLLPGAMDPKDPASIRPRSVPEVSRIGENARAGFWGGYISLIGPPEEQLLIRTQALPLDYISREEAFGLLQLHLDSLIRVYTPTHEQLKQFEAALKPMADEQRAFYTSGPGKNFDLIMDRWRQGMQARGEAFRPEHLQWLRNELIRMREHDPLRDVAGIAQAIQPLLTPAQKAIGPYLGRRQDIDAESRSIMDAIDRSYNPKDEQRARIQALLRERTSEQEQYCRTGPGRELDALYTEFVYLDRRLRTGQSLDRERRIRIAERMRILGMGKPLSPSTLAHEVEKYLSPEQVSAGRGRFIAGRPDNILELDRQRVLARDATSRWFTSGADIRRWYRLVNGFNEVLDLSDDQVVTARSLLEEMQKRRDEYLEQTRGEKQSIDQTEPARRVALMDAYLRPVDALEDELKLRLNAIPTEEQFAVARQAAIRAEKEAIQPLDPASPREIRVWLNPAKATRPTDLIFLEAWHPEIASISQEPTSASSTGESVTD